MDAIKTADDIIGAVDRFGFLPFWAEESFSAWKYSAVSFMKLWNLREKAVNSQKLAYGKFVCKKATFVSLKALPYLCAMRRDGYDFDSLVDEGRAPVREKEVMGAIDGPTPSYALGKSLGMKGFDGVVTSLQNKTYLCLNFKKSSMGSALLCTPESLFGSELVRSAYDMSVSGCAEKLKTLCADALSHYDEKTAAKILSAAV